MTNPYGIPEITVQEVAEKRANGDSFLLVDVREPAELISANLGEGVLLLPLSRLTREQLDGLPDEIKADKSQEIVVLCHHGMRSAQVTAWLKQQGWENVINMQGGIDAYAREIDPTIGIY